MSTMSIVNAMIDGMAERVNRDELVGHAVTRRSKDIISIPTQLSELNQQISRTYDLSITAAGDLNIPVVGSVSGGFDRRVVILERTAYKAVREDQIEYLYGYAVRLAITVNKVTADMKLTLPFMAASAEVGLVEGKWILHVIGLAGKKIDAAILPPTELSVETFVLAKQSLAHLIDAVHDSSTEFTAAPVGIKKPAAVVEREYRIAVGRAYALGRIYKGRSLSRALRELDSYDDILKDTVTDTYKEYAGITNDSSEPTTAVRDKARTTLGDVKVEPR